MKRRTQQLYLDLLFCIPFSQHTYPNGKLDHMISINTQASFYLILTSYTHKHTHRHI